MATLALTKLRHALSGSSKQERAKLIRKKLNQLYPDPKIPLKHTSSYTLLIAVLLSAQCTDVRVNQTTPLLFAKAKTPLEMSKLSVAEIQKIIRPCGLFNNKSKAIHNLSKQLLEKHAGRVPKTFEELEALPGVGHKTASVMMSHAFHNPAFPVDTHIHRCAKRWGLSNGKSVAQTEKDLKALFPKSAWNKIHLQMVYYGREYCPARGHKRSDCPICSSL